MRGVYGRASSTECEPTGERASAKEFWRARVSASECERVLAQREAARGNTTVTATVSS